MSDKKPFYNQLADEVSKRKKQEPNTAVNRAIREQVLGPRNLDKAITRKRGNRQQWRLTMQSDEALIEAFALRVFVKFPRNSYEAGICQEVIRRLRVRKELANVGELEY